MAGLLATQVLAEHHREVVVVERDRLPAGVADRNGVAQGRHSHALLARGNLELESRFPGLTDELVEAGARTGDMLDDARLHFGGHRLRSHPSDVTVISCSRAFLEGHVRQRVLAGPNVTLVEGCDAAGLTMDPEGGRVTGVRLLRRTDGSAEETLAGDLVVDTTGRSSRSGTWLEAAGYGTVPVERVVVDVAYASRRYRMDADALDGDLAILKAPNADRPRGGVLALLEDGQAMVTLAGILGDRPPLDPAGFLAYAEALSIPDLHHAVADAEPIDDPVPHRFPASTWRHVERLGRLPDGFAVLGDSLCSFNPIYGQGMTVAALQAEVLDQHLRRHGTVRPQRLQRELARLVRTPWQMAAGADLQFPGVEGRRTRGQRWLGAYIARLQAAAATDPTLGRAFIRVSGLVDPPQALLRPAVVRRVLRRRRRPSEARC